MIKKVNFYTVSLFDTQSLDVESSYDKIKPLIIEVINNYAYDVGDFKVLDLSEQSHLHQSVDVFSYKNGYLFLRASNQKPSGAYLQRNYVTNAPEAVLGGISEREEGIEQYTYIYLDYSTGILGIVNQQGAPNYKIVDSMVSKYYPNYYLEFKAIPNADGIDRIYYARDSKISQIEIEVPVPDAGVLQKIFGWNTKDILNVQNGTLKATMRLSGVERHPITSDSREIKGLVDCIKSSIDQYSKAKIRGKIDRERMQDYSFFDENFTYPVDIPMYRIVNGEKRYLSATELVQIYRENLTFAFNSNRELLRTVANR